MSTGTRYANKRSNAARASASTRAEIHSEECARQVQRCGGCFAAEMLPVPAGNSTNEKSRLAARSSFNALQCNWVFYLNGGRETTASTICLPTPGQELVVLTRRVRRPLPLSNSVAAGRISSSVMPEATVKSSRRSVLSVLSCNCQLLCKSGCTIGLTHIFTRSKSENDLSATEIGRRPSSCIPATIAKAG